MKGNNIGKTIKPSKPHALNTNNKNKDIESHKQLDEELKPLSFINKAVSEINGVKGVYIEEGFEFKNVFSWNSTHVFNIYEADANGRKINENAKPFLYAIGKYNPCCDCQRSCGGCCCKGCNQSFEMIITKDSEQADEKSPETIFYIEKNNISQGFYQIAQVFMNQNGKNNMIGELYTNTFGYIITSNKYVNNLQLKYDICQPSVWCGCCCCKSCRETEFQIIDEDDNQGVLMMESTVCQWGFNNFRIGFPPKYDTDQNAIVLASAIYFAFERSNKKRRNEADTFSMNRRRY